MASGIPAIKAFSSRLKASDSCTSFMFINNKNRFFICLTGSSTAQSRNGSRNSVRGKWAAKYVNDLTKQSYSVSCCNLHHITLQAQCRLVTMRFVARSRPVLTHGTCVWESCIYSAEVQCGSYAFRCSPLKAAKPNIDGHQC